MFAATVKPETRFVSLVAVMGGGVFRIPTAIMVMRTAAMILVNAIKLMTVSRQV
jgi:hypothetical protein